MEQTSLKRPLEDANQDAPAKTGPTKQAKISAFFVRAADPSPPKRPCVEQSTNALIYEWTLDLIDPEHTCQEMFEARKREHINDARSKPKELGLHWAIRVFGVGAFTVRMVDTTRLPRVQAMEWANEREIALIAEHGGVMRDCEPSKPMHQTFNLTSGGQGIPHWVWEALQASSRKKLMKVWPKFRAYYEAQGHLRVPISDTVLGTNVLNIRSRKTFLGHADFKAWLDERGFVYEVPRAHLEEEVWPKFRAYYDEHGHLRVPISDPDLGEIVHCIRKRNAFMSHADFKAWLYECGFKMHATDATKNAERWAAVNGASLVPDG
jgi:hypothetical protein